jgi:serine-type D-Ala-D-Ala carboxypeptidase (penicillin-binding protein 5/6)
MQTFSFRLPSTGLASLLALALDASLLALALAGTAAHPAAAIETLAREAILVDMTTGAVLLEKNADQPMPPASMSKIMTSYMVFERLKAGKLSMEDTLPVSENAWRKGGCVSDGSTMCLKLDERVKIQDLIQGIIVQSGNDACIVIAEGLAGSEEAFADQMNKKAKEIELQHSVFRNSTGLPDPEHVMTARDLTILAERTIEDHPEYYHFYSEKNFTYNGIKQGNRNPLLYKNIGADGLKTGHTQAAGYGLTASAKQGDRRLVLVVTGLPSMQARAEESERLIDYGFREFENVALFKTGEQVDVAEVWLGEEETVPLQAAGDLVFTLPRRGRDGLQVKVVYDGPIPAPITKGDRIATLQVTAPGMPAEEAPLVAGADVPEKGFFGRAFAALGTWVGHLVP